MKGLVFSLVLFLIFSTDAVFAPLSIPTKENMDADWSALFPEIPGCEREIQPPTRNGEIFEQRAVYKPQIPEKTNPPMYFGCGWIALRFEPSALKSADALYATQSGSPFFGRRKVKTFDAYTRSPFCGNDVSRGSVSVYFDEDKVLIVNAGRGAGNLLEFAERADYEQMKKRIDDFIKTKSEKK